MKELVEDVTAINCIDANGHSKTFYYICEKNVLSGEYTYRVYCQKQMQGEWFELSLKPCSDELRVTMVNRHNRPEYKAKGIPEALIRTAALKYKMKITSSTNKEEYKCFPNEWRIEAVSKIFQRLDADYDSETDLYTYVAKG